MYKQRDDLQRLINSLTTGEKRHFTGLFSPKNKAESLPLYLQLYQLYEKGKSKPDNYLPEVSARSLIMARKRLYDNIIESLLLFHHEKSTNTVLQNKLSSLDILYAKGLAEQALVIWNKAYLQAVEQEKFNILLQLLDWEKRLNIVLDSPTRDSITIKDEEESVLKKLQQIHALERIFSHIMLLKKQHGFIKSDLRYQLEAETVLAPDMPSAKDCLSTKAIFYHDLIRSIYHWMIFEHTEGYAYSLKLLEHNPENIMPNDFLYGILQHITSCVCILKFNETLNGIELGKFYLETYDLSNLPKFVGQVFVYEAIYSIIVHSYMGNKSKLSQCVEDTELRLESYSNFIPIDLRKVVLGNLMIGHMALGNMDKAEEFWQLVYDKQYRKVREDITADLYFFRLFSLLHTKQYDLIPSAARSAYHYYTTTRSSSDMFEAELSISSLLRKDQNYEKTETLRELLEFVKSTLNNFIKDINNINGFQEHYTRYVIWADAILHDEPFYLAAQRWYADNSQ